MAKASNTKKGNAESAVQKTAGGNTRPKKDPHGLHAGHRDRLKKRFLETGFTGFNEHQIVELLLFYAYPRVDTNDKAHELINKFGSIPGILDASYDELTKDGLLTESAAVLFKLILCTIPIYCNTQNDSISHDNWRKLINLFEPRFIGLDHEEFHLACFDAQLRLIICTVISKGGMTSSSVDIRKLVEVALASKATTIAVAHNHPKGPASPSPDDIQLTQLIDTTMYNIGIRLIDHIIVGESNSISMKDRGKMKFLN